MTTQAASARQAAPPAGTTLLVAAVIVHDRDAARVLLIQRGPGAKFAAGSWDLPVGKSEPGEPITATAIRELKEETGLLVRPGDLSIAHVIHCAQGVEAPSGFLTIVFAARRWRGTPVNAEPDRHSQVAWVATSDIPGDFVPTTATALRAYLDGGPPLISTDGW